MKLELAQITINDIQFADQTKVSDSTLYINRKELLKVIGQDSRIIDINLEIVHPGDKVRIIPVKDVIEPRVKAEGPGDVFPGFIGGEEMVGSGLTKVLKGAAVVTTGEIVGFQEGIIDMSGPGAEYSPFSKLHNLVVDCDVKENIKQHEHEEILRMAGLKTADYLAKAARDIEPDEVEFFEAKPFLEAAAEYPDLPKVGYVYMLQSQGLLHDTYVYGVDAKEIIPSLISPTEVMDGAIISGNCVSACDKNTTYVHQNNPVIEELYKYHGQKYNFMGVIITNENVTLADKERSSNYTAKLAKMLSLDAVIVSEEGFGNPDADLIMNSRKLAAKGIETVLITDEYAGRDGASQSLADADPSADAVVTAGNANEVITLPPMEKVIGHQNFADVIAGGFDGSLGADGSISVEIQAITGSTNELGFNNLTARTY
ncbi:MAG: glycine/sarcosine/betaine reductase component B subunit [Halanaerobium sp.]